MSCARAPGPSRPVGDACGAGTGCGSCLDRICGIITSVDPAHGQPVLRRVG